MLSFNNLSLRRGSSLLFEEVSFTVHRDNKVGLVGANGTGKTSLFKMIKGGEIIPKIVEVLDKKKPQMPNVEYKWNETHKEIIVKIL